MPSSFRLRPLMLMIRSSPHTPAPHLVGRCQRELRCRPPALERVLGLLADVRESSRGRRIMRPKSARRILRLCCCCCCGCCRWKPCCCCLLHLTQPNWLRCLPKHAADLVDDQQELDQDEEADCQHGVAVQHHERCVHHVRDAANLSDALVIVLLVHAAHAQEKLMAR